jgi:hypothetical protein
MRAPRCCRTGTSSRRARVGSCGCVGLARAVRSWKRAWSDQSTSWTAFHNALRGLEPRGHAVGPRLLPPGRDGSEPPLFTFALKAEPSLTELARDGHGSVEWRFTPVRSESTLRNGGRAFAARCRRPAVDLSSLRRGGGHQPHFPAFARRVEKGPITHARSSVALCAKVCAHLCCFARRVPPRANSATGFSIFSRENVRSTLRFLQCSQRVSSFLPASRWSKLSSALNTKK